MRKSWLIAIGLMTIVFVLLVMLMPVTANEPAFYHTSASGYRAWFALVELPVVVLWGIAFYGTTRLQSYAAAIAGSPEGTGFSGLARGCLWLAWGLPVSAIAGLALAAVAGHQTAMTAPAVIASNYISLIFPIFAFSIMSNSTARMRSYYNLAPRRNRLSGRQQLLLAVIGVVYAYMFLHSLRTGNDTISAANNSYFLPLWLLIIGLIVPYLYAWFLGLLTVFDIVALATRSPGIIYRRALRLLSAGIVVIICSLMCVQFLRAQLPHQHASLRLHLLAVYVVYFLTIAGFLLLLSGVRQLQKIEEV